MVPLQIMLNLPVENVTIPAIFCLVLVAGAAVLYVITMISTSGLDNTAQLVEKLTKLRKNAANKKNLSPEETDHMETLWEKIVQKIPECIAHAKSNERGNEWFFNKFIHSHFKGVILSLNTYESEEMEHLLSDFESKQSTVENLELFLEAVTVFIEKQKELRQTMTDFKTKDMGYLLIKKKETLVSFLQKLNGALSVESVEKLYAHVPLLVTEFPEGYFDTLEKELRRAWIDLVGKEGWKKLEKFSELTLPDRLFTLEESISSYGVLAQGTFPDALQTYTAFANTIRDSLLQDFRSYTTQRKQGITESKQLKAFIKQLISWVPALPSLEKELAASLKVSILEYIEMRTNEAVTPLAIDEYMVSLEGKKDLYVTYISEPVFSQKVEILLDKKDGLFFAQGITLTSFEEIEAQYNQIREGSWQKKSLAEHLTQFIIDQIDVKTTTAETPEEIDAVLEFLGEKCEVYRPFVSIEIYATKMEALYAKRDEAFYAIGIKAERYMEIQEYYNQIRESFTKREDLKMRLDYHVSKATVPSLDAVREAGFVKTDMVIIHTDNPSSGFEATKAKTA